MKYAFAHRGGRGHGPDNVLPTFAEALARGATALETDAWVTADGVVVLDHDGVHNAGRPDQVSITQVQRAELAPHIPTLADLYEHCGTDFDLAIDIKGDGAGEAISRVADAYGAADRLWLFTPNLASPESLAAQHPGVTVRGQELQRNVRNTLIAQLADDGVQVVNARWQFWRRSAVHAVHSYGMLAFAWDVQGPLALWWCRRTGIDGIFSDHVSLLKRALPPK
jgi:glycerophosphoryl diester phosphodiesterase